MSLLEIIKNIKLEKVFSNRTASTYEIIKLENDYSVRLPEDYKQFLLYFGCGRIGNTEIYGLGCPDNAIPNLRFVIESVKKDNKSFPEMMIPIGKSFEGCFICILCAPYKNLAYGAIIECKTLNEHDKIMKNEMLIASSFENYIKIISASQNIKE